MPPTAYLIRTYAHTHTQGMFSALNEYGNILFSCVTLELPWRDNRKGMSCIPEGTYQVQHRTSPKHADHFQVLDVPGGRDLILFHPGNYVKQLLGCILPGERFADLDRDGVPDILNTRATLNAMLAALGQAFTLHVLSAPGSSPISGSSPLSISSPISGSSPLSRGEGLGGEAQTAPEKP